MKKLWTAAFLGLLLLAIGCSSTPPGTISIGELQKTAASKLGQDVVVVGTAETKTSLSAFRMFKLYNKGDFIWVTIPESEEEPAQGMKYRVSGPLQQKKFDLIGETYYIEATSLRVE